MKYFIIIVSIIAITLIFVFAPLANNNVEVEYLRIHIRANSNSIEDQNVKYKVKDEIVEALIPVLSEVETFEEAKSVISNNFSLITSVADNVLKQEGFNYSSRAKIDNEYFPTRSYQQITLKEGNYDALIVELGSGTGDNWWCIVFPAFCFTKTQNSDNIVYISRIWDIIKSVI